MKQNKENLDNIIDAAARAVRDESIDDSVIDNSAKLVWSRIATSMAENQSVATGNEFADANAGQIDGCDDFQRLIPQYLAGRLSPARELLVKDHTGECIPCRRALKDHKTPVAAPVAAKTQARPAPVWRRPATLRWSIAAALLVCFGLAGLFAFERFDWSGRSLAATLEATDGDVFLVSGGGDGRQLRPGEQVLKGQHVRTAKNSTAVLRLADGSTVEMRERSEFSVTENRRGVTVKLDRGDVIVEAAKQDRGRLYVQTPDSLVSVKGTIFAVESGTKGSRVSVVEGEVKVQHSGKDETLLPGDQTTTERLERKGVGDAVAWSRNAQRYVTLVGELAGLRREINERVAMPGVRYSSRLISLVPEKTVVFAALPNLTDTLAEAERIMLERINQNPALAEWWKAREDKKRVSDKLMFARVREFGSHFGNEIVVSAETGSDGIMVLSELKDAAAFRIFLDGELAKAANATGELPKIKFVDDPATFTRQSSDKDKSTQTRGELFVSIRDNIFAATNEVKLLSGLAQKLSSPESNAVPASAFFKRIADAYTEGAGILIAADIETIFAQKTLGAERPVGDNELDALGRLGLLNLRHFVAEQKDVDGQTLSRADLTFGETRRGIASWLARPGSMGALEFVSPEASVATAFVVKEPAMLVDDLLGFIGSSDPSFRNDFDAIQKTQGIDIKRDFAEPLGGEFAFALDGPVLPNPSWKAVFEVYDQARFQAAIENAVEKLNQFGAANGGKQLVWENTTSGSRTYYSLKSSDADITIFYLYSDGYMVVAPSRALLDQSLRNRESGNSLIRSPRFKSALPRDGNVNFSAIFYHDLAPLVGPLAERMKKAGGELTGEQRGALDAISANAPPTLVYAYADEQRVTVASNADGGAFGLNPASLIGLPDAFEMENILNNAMGDDRAPKN